MLSRLHCSSFGMRVSGNRGRSASRTVAEGSSMTLAYDLFWSFRSPYSYLVTPRLLEREREFDVKVAVRPV